MKYKFDSKYYVGEQKGNIFFRIFIFVMAAFFLILWSIKIFVGDFELTSIGSVVFLFFLIWILKGRIGTKSQYVNATGEILFTENNMEIVYYDILIKNKRIKEITNIKYSDIESIELGKELSCFRIVSKAKKIKVECDTGKETLISNREDIIENFMYVASEEEQQNIKEAIFKNTNIKVKVMEEQM